jgi:hypothetical protein
VTLLIPLDRLRPQGEGDTRQTGTATAAKRLVLMESDMAKWTYHPIGTLGVSLYEGWSLGNTQSGQGRVIKRGNRYDAEFARVSDHGARKVFDSFDTLEAAQAAVEQRMAAYQKRRVKRG